MDKKWHVFAGEWVGSGCNGEAFRVGYVGQLDSWWNGWAVPSFSADVASAVIEEQQRSIADDPHGGWTESLAWGDAGSVVQTYLFDDIGPADRVQVSYPNRDGLVHVGQGWTWEEVNIDDCGSIVCPEVFRSFACVIERGDVDREGFHGLAPVVEVWPTLAAAVREARVSVDGGARAVSVVALLSTVDEVDAAGVEAGALLGVIEP